MELLEKYSPAKSISNAVRRNNGCRQLLFVVFRIVMEPVKNFVA